jgi:P4 family phage/plasmid primase-like protien
LNEEKKKEILKLSQKENEIIETFTKKLNSQTNLYSYEHFLEDFKQFNETIKKNIKSYIENLQENENNEYFKKYINRYFEKYENNDNKLNLLINEIMILFIKAKDTNLSPGERQNLKEKIEEMIVDFLKNKYYVVTIRDDDRQGNYETFVYHEGIYKKDAISYLSEDIRKIFGQSYSSQKANKIISKIQVDTFEEAEEFFKEQDVYKIPVLNGILNIKTRKLEAFNPKYRFFNKLPVVYNPENDCKKIKKFLADIVKESSDVDLLQEMIGFSILREYRYEKAFMLSGNGRNGKSKLLQLIKLLLGIENCSSISLQDLENDDFSKSNLLNKLVNIAGDISNEAIKNAGNFKALTGRDLITANRKFKNHIKFINYAKMFFSSNELPTTYDLTEAFFMRWIIIDFPYKFISEEEYKKSEDKINLKIRNEKIIEEITSQEEMSGLLNFALEGLERLEKNRDFTYSKQTEEVKKIWLRKSNSFNAFCMDCLEEDYNSYIVKQELKSNYVKYCRIYKLKIAGDKAIKNILSTTFGASESQLSTENKMRVWTGIKFLPEQGEQGILPLYQNSTISYIGEKPCESCDTYDNKNISLKEFDDKIEEELVFNEVLDLIGKDPISFEELQNKLNLSELDLQNQLKILRQNGDILENPAGIYILLK